MMPLPAAVMINHDQTFSKCWDSAFALVVIVTLLLHQESSLAADDVCYDNTDDAFLYEPTMISARIDKWTTALTNDCAIDQNDETNSYYKPILQVVTTRDFILGCSSFEEYFSPRFHTLFFIPHYFASMMKLDELVSNATADHTAGAHLFLLRGETGGDVLARRVAEQFDTRELQPRGIQVKYLSFISCEIHQLPRDHDMFVPLEDVVVQMMDDLKLAQEYRERGQYLETNYRDPRSCGSKCKMKVLATNTLLFHDVRDPKTLNHLHGKDIFYWQMRDGWKNKPKHVVDSNLPWLVDNSLNFEDHAAVFDLELLRTLKDEFLLAHPLHFINNDLLIGRLANKFNMTLIRNQDLKMHSNFGLSPDEIRFPPHVDVDWLKGKGLLTMAAFRNPRQLTESWDRAAQSSQIAPFHGTNDRSVRFLCDYFNAAWLPSTFRRKGAVADPNVQAVLRGLLHYLGYPFVKQTHHGKNTTASGSSLEFRLDGSFPQNRVLEILPSRKKYDAAKWTKLLSYRVDRISFSLLLCDYHVEECSQAAQLSFSSEQRSLVIPVDAVLEDITIDSNCGMWSDWTVGVERNPGGEEMA